MVNIILQQGSDIKMLRFVQHDKVHEIKYRFDDVAAHPEAELRFRMMWKDELILYFNP